MKTYRMSVEIRAVAKIDVEAESAAEAIAKTESAPVWEIVDCSEPLEESAAIERVEVERVLSEERAFTAEVSNISWDDEGESGLPTTAMVKVSVISVCGPITASEERHAVRDALWDAFKRDAIAFDYRRVAKVG